MKHRKIFLAAAVLAVLLLVVAGCGKKTEQPPVTKPPVTQPGPAPSDPVPSKYPTVDYMYGFELPGNWNNVPSSEFTAFYPGQASWQWLTSSAHPGSGGLNGGTGCLACHSGAEQQLGDSLVAGNNKYGLEPDPVAGKDGFKKVNVQAAYDNDKFYLKVEWESERPGISHELWRYDGEKWNRWSSSKPSALKAGNMPSYEDRFAVILDDQNIPAFDGANLGFEQVGCWQTCHSSMRDMPNQPKKDEVQPILSQDDVRKYLLTSRTDYSGESGNWDDLKSKEQIDGLLSAGQFLDLWQFRAARSGPIGYASDDYVLDYRYGDKGGRNPFFTPDQPDFMFNESILGFKAIPEDKFEEMLLKAVMVSEATGVGYGPTVVPMDQNAKFNVGDIVARRILWDPTESRADVQVFSKWENGKWTAIFVRDLDTGQPTDKSLSDGNIYNVGFGIFDDHVTTRRHFVTLPMTLGLGVDADIKAVKIN